MVDAGGQHVPPILPPRRAAVTPRVRTSPTSGALPLERVVRGFIDAGARGVIVVHAPPGGGKTAALRHLHAVLPELLSRVHIVDEPIYTAHLRQHFELSVVALPAPRSHDDLAILELVPWAEDEWIEYLAANHRAMVASVMSRLRDDATRHAPQGSPQLWAIVLDEMAADERLATARDALRKHLLALLPDRRAHLGVGAAAVHALGGKGTHPPKPAEMPDQVVSFLRHRTIRLMLAADWLVLVLAAGGAPPVMLGQSIPPDLLLETGVVLRTHPAAREHLLDLLRRERDRTHDAIAASLLFAADPSWRPRASLRGRRLHGARLDGASWNEIDLTGADLTGATLRHARLARAVLASTALASADLSGADLSDANLNGASASDANFTGANLGRCRADGARFWSAQFRDADLSNAHL